jgi:hypothetical protein
MIPSFLERVDGQDDEGDDNGGHHCQKEWQENE